MVLILCVGDDLFAYAVDIVAEGYNRHSRPKEPWEVYDVPNVGDFNRGEPDGLRSWLKGEIPGWPSKPSYDVIVIDSFWADLVPVIKKVHPQTPTVMLLAPEGRQIAGIDVMLGGGANAILALPKTLEGLMAAKR